ncbi:MAG: hypothetical protein JRJ12_16655 [Deltaproteobacteria bacterium]|nr:hypothetical protein [Deltaproteobacteria bacterium]
MLNLSKQYSQANHKPPIVVVAIAQPVIGKTSRPEDLPNSAFWWLLLTSSRFQPYPHQDSKVGANLWQEMLKVGIP